MGLINLNSAKIIIKPPTLRRISSERVNWVSFSDAIPMVINIGKVPRPKLNIIKAPFRGCALARLHASAE